MAHRTAIHDQHMEKGQAKLTKDEIARRYNTGNELHNATGKTLRADRTHVEADLRDSQNSGPGTA